MPTYRWAARSTTPGDWRWTVEAVALLFAEQLAIDQATVLASAEWIVTGHSILGQAGTYIDGSGVGTYPDPAYVHADAGDYGPTGTEYTPELSALVNWTIIVPPSAIDAGRVQQICEALIYLLATADAAGAFARTLGTDRAYTTDLTLEAPVGTLSVLAVPAFTHRRRTSNGTWRRDVVVEILVRTHLDADAEVDQATTDAGMYLIEQIDDYLAHPDHQTLTLPDGVLAIYVEPTDMRAEADIRSDAGAMWMREHLTHLRQVTGLVRVAYYLDVAY